MKIARPEGAIAPRQTARREGPSLVLSGKAAAFNRYDGGLGRFAVAKASKFRTENDVPKVTYIAFNGAAHAVDVPVGRSLMEGAVGNNVPGIDGDCGGAAACATCHIYVSPDWQAKMQPRSTLETDMLDCAEDVSGDSRLSCQIAMSEALDGLVVRLPATQR